METRLHAQLKAAQPLSFTPIHSGLLQRKCACGGTPGPTSECEECGKKKLQRRASNSPASSSTHHPPSSVSEVPPIVHEVLRSPGQPLDSGTRAFMEPRFGHDFSRVRVHNDLQAARSARAVEAFAYTVGQNIVFGEGYYAPQTSIGQRLLAHELTHTVQQRNAANPPYSEKISLGPADSVQESEAESASKNLRNAEAVTTTPQVQRWPLPFYPSSPPKCALAEPKDCDTYEAWLDTFPAAVGTADRTINDAMPADLSALITGKLSTGGGMPDCADVALLLRHYYLKAKDQSLSFMVGRDKASADTFTLGKTTSDKEIRACMLGAGTESFQEERSGFALVNFYREKGKKILNLKRLTEAGLKAGDVFVWKRLASKTGNFQGHAQTVQTVTPSKPDPKDASKTAQEGTITLVQGNMQEGKGKGLLQQRVYSFSELTGTPTGNADILEEPKNREESFFGAGPWKS